MKQLPKIFGITLAVIAYGIFRDFSVIDIIAWTIVIAALAIPTAWLLSKIVTVKASISRDE